LNQFKRREKYLSTSSWIVFYLITMFHRKKKLKIKHLEEMIVGFSMVRSGGGRGIKKLKIVNFLYKVFIV
jgi:hypothetical protein